MKMVSEVAERIRPTIALPPVLTKVDLDVLNGLVEQKYLTRRKHDQADLWIWNYTPRTQFDHFWTNETRMCRGLITDAGGTVLYRPFAKFFNLHETADDPPIEPFVVFDKVDGSLGVQYRAPDGWALATRGSFDSPQAHEGTRMLREKYGHLTFREDKTYLWEIIYPANRIVVDYGRRRDIVLLAVIDTTTGKDDDAEVDRLEAEGVTVVERFESPDDPEDLVFLDEGQTDREGWVVRFESGIRMKVKLAEYARVHRLLTGISPRFIWEQLRDGKDLTPLIDRAPAGFVAWINQHADLFRTTYRFVEKRAEENFAKRPMDADRKTSALYFQTCDDRAILFKMLDGHSYDQAIWKMIRPDGGRPYKIIDE